MSSLDLKQSLNPARDARSAEAAGRGAAPGQVPAGSVSWGPSVRAHPALPQQPTSPGRARAPVCPPPQAPGGGPGATAGRRSEIRVSPHKDEEVVHPGFGPGDRWVSRRGRPPCASTSESRRPVAPDPPDPGPDPLDRDPDLPCADPDLPRPRPRRPRSP